MQKAAVANPDWEGGEIQQRLVAVKPEMASVFSIRDFARTGETGQFQATVEVCEMLGFQKRIARVDNKTNAGIGEFVIEPA